MLFVPLVDIARDFFPRQSRQPCLGLPSFPFIGYLELTVREQSGRDLELTIHLHLKLKLRISGAMLILSICPHGLHVTPVPSKFSNSFVSYLNEPASWSSRFQTESSFVIVSPTRTFVKSEVLCRIS
jgi:hypothetical protein